MKEKIAALKKRMEQLKEIAVLVQATPDKQFSLTDPDARPMQTSGKGTGVVGYNVQTAVDAQHHLIGAHEVTNVGNENGASSDRNMRACSKPCSSGSIEHPKKWRSRDRRSSSRSERSRPGWGRLTF